MIRRIHLSLLVIACCGSAFAQPLYKWTEADGSITFSPEKPPASVEFEVINTSDSMVPSTVHSRASANAVLDPANDSQGISQISFSEPDSSEPDAPNLFTRERTDSNTESQLLYSSGGTSQQPSSGIESMSFGSQSAQRLAAAAYAANKQHRCDDLKKRVVSLERRMRAKLTPEDMDNTVIHMSKYQRVFDQDCVK